MFFALTKTFRYDIARVYKVKSSQPAVPLDVEIGVAHRIKDITIVLLRNENKSRFCISSHNIDPIYRDIDLKNDIQEEVKKLIKMAMEVLE